MSYAEIQQVIKRPPVSIIGLYVGFVLIIGRFVRVFFSGISSQIMFQELPYVSDVMDLCLNIYLVRENQDYRLEEDLFAKLIFLYRSTETMIAFTRIPQDKIKTD